MATLVIPDLDDAVALRLRERAATRGRSPEDEVRFILADVLSRPQSDGPVRTGADLANAIREAFAPFGGVELDIPPRGPGRPLPTFD